MSELKNKKPAPVAVRVYAAAPSSASS